MWIKDFFDWLTFASYKRKLDELEESIRSAQRTNAEWEQLNAELDRCIKLWRKLNHPEFPRTKLWEEARFKGLPVRQRPQGVPPVEVRLEDELQHWLWQHAWDACVETGDWDLVTAAAGIARGMRTDGVPLSAGLRAAAGEYKGGSE